MSSRGKKFTQSEDVFLAQEVEKYPTLWDCTIENYRRADLKPNLWSRIAGAMGPDVKAEEVSKRFKNMKETFASNHRKVRESQKKCSGKGADETFSPSWFLYKYLQYLVKTCAQADSESNLSAPVDSEDSNSLSPLTHYYDVTMQQWFPIPDDYVVSDPNVQEENTDKQDCEVTLSTSTCNESQRSSKRPARPAEDYFFQKKGATKKSNNNLLQSAVQAIEKIASDPFTPPIVPEAEKKDQFSNFVSSRLASLDPSTRKQCENEILQVLLKY